MHCRYKRMYTPGCDPHPPDRLLSLVRVDSQDKEAKIKRRALGTCDFLKDDGQSVDRSNSKIVHLCVNLLMCFRDPSPD